MDIDNIHKKKLPTLRPSFYSFRWRLLFLFDLIFELSLRKKDAKGRTIIKHENPSFIGKQFKKIHSKNIQILMKRKKFESNGPVAITEINIKDFTHDNFKEWKNKVNEPVVVRGFLSDAPITELTKEENLISKFGDIEVECANFSFDKDISPDGRNINVARTSLRDYLTLDKYNNYYVNNFHGILNRMDFYRLCNGRKLRKIQKKDYALHQWFIKRDAGSRSSLHSANAENIFLNIQGKKEWHFIHPSYAPVLQTTLSKYGTFAVSELMNHGMKGNFYELMHKEHPYFNNIPVYKVTLEPGDLLYNPPWWWHDVRNLSSLTVGCATRWVEPLKPGSKLITNSSILFTGQIIEFLKNPKKSPIYTISRAVNNKNEVNEFFNTVFASEWDKKSKEESV